MADIGVLQDKGSDLVFQHAQNVEIQDLTLGNIGVFNVTSQVETAATRSWTRRLGIWALFIGLTAAMTWPMATVFASRTVDHFDIFFNMWRLRWIHHALTTPGTALFDGNQFYPEKAVL